MFASEHGQSANDEINIIIEGNNYGWPIIEGVETAEGMETPILTSGSDDTWAPSGMAFYKNLCMWRRFAVKKYLLSIRKIIKLLILLMDLAAFVMFFRTANLCILYRIIPMDVEILPQMMMSYID